MKPSDAASPRNRFLALAAVALTGSLALTGCDSLDELPDPTRSEAAPAPGGSALQAAEGLTVKGRAPKTGYARDEFGSAWIDTDRNGCGTRDDILAEQLDDVSRDADGCKVLSGVLDPDPYTGTRISFERGRSKVDIDHLVALSDAWQKGAQKWSDAKRRAFANDPLNLVAADSSTNRRKGDGDTATWLPPNKDYRCAYVAGQVSVKKKYGLWVTQAEQDAMKEVLTACPRQKLLAGGNPTEAPTR
ncbi:MULTISPECIES: HNH endonuclease family protein [unclassified Streptomyces]|uniref:HNH endonuclease family protein n=1 Tax=unclassified Streptomyces TaxID=2593676 RepID=UPI0011C6EFD7|nr:MULTISPECIES: HNH endonuclease family protein [unclassified Streptomyces]TXS09358.1 HNH endonuclease [Streptomyces sp. wa22]WSQ79401.1 HNH endonuclease family protein [Streptomyces sp. NBC_01213]WSR07201.1 HNH endonuclease family protein [Streptomyces sp. NBC_01208]